MDLVKMIIIILVQKEYVLITMDQEVSGEASPYAETIRDQSLVAALMVKGLG